jgi:hypothetical protein
MIKEEMAFMNIAGFTITADLGNLGYLYIRVEVNGSATREKYEEERKHQYSCKY